MTKPRCLDVVTYTMGTSEYIDNTSGPNNYAGFKQWMHSFTGSDQTYDPQVGRIVDLDHTTYIYNNKGTQKKYRECEVDYQHLRGQIESLKWAKLRELGQIDRKYRAGINELTEKISKSVRTLHSLQKKANISIKRNHSNELASTVLATWFTYGKRNRVTKPAQRLFKLSSGRIQWLKDRWYRKGLAHRELDKPSKSSHEDIFEYRWKGVLHRLTGPAIGGPLRKEEYYLLGRKLHKDRHEILSAVLRQDSSCVRYAGNELDYIRELVQIGLEHGPEAAWNFIFPPEKDPIGMPFDPEAFNLKNK